MGRIWPDDADNCSQCYKYGNLTICDIMVDAGLSVDAACLDYCASNQTSNLGTEYPKTRYYSYVDTQSCTVTGPDGAGGTCTTVTTIDAYIGMVACLTISSPGGIPVYDITLEIHWAYVVDTVVTGGVRCGVSSKCVYQGVAITGQSPLVYCQSSGCTIDNTGIGCLGVLGVSIVVGPTLPLSATVGCSECDTSPVLSFSG
jgi:hypothetical protein